MSRYHDRTLQLLGDKEVREKPVPKLLEWARATGVVLPEAYLEWAQLDRNNLLGRYSNDDWFCFDTPEIVTTPEGIRGLLFNRENQGNFEKIVTLNQGDDPPVPFAWIGTPP